MKNGITNILEISTAHIEKSDNDLLKNETGFSIGVYEYGYYFHLPSSDNESIDKYSNSFKKILVYAVENNCQFVCLDCDATELDTTKLNTSE